jgi:hypothetical protein
MLSSGSNVIIWDEMLSSGMKCYHLELMLSSGTTCYHLGLHVIIWDAMLSSGANVIIWDKMLSSGANVVMVLSGAIVIIWCYHVMLSSGIITHPFLFFLKTSLTPTGPPCLKTCAPIYLYILYFESFTFLQKRFMCT